MVVVGVPIQVLEFLVNECEFARNYISARWTVNNHEKVRPPLSRIVSLSFGATCAGATAKSTVLH